MPALLERPTFITVSGDEDGAEIQRRRSKLGLSIKALAERSGVDRDTISKIEKGGPSRAATVGQINAALDRLEHEMGMDLPAAVSDLSGEGLVTFSVTGNFGVSVTVAGPVGNMAELQASVSQIVEQMQNEARDNGS